jgi:hypothetical protein
MIIDQLVLIVTKDSMIWIADGFQVPVSWLTGKIVNRMCVIEEK